MRRPSARFAGAALDFRVTAGWDVVVSAADLDRTALRVLGSSFGALLEN